MALPAVVLPENPSVDLAYISFRLVNVPVEHNQKLLFLHQHVSISWLSHAHTHGARTRVLRILLQLQRLRRSLGLLFPAQAMRSEHLERIKVEYYPQALLHSHPSQAAAGSYCCGGAAWSAGLQAACSGMFLFPE